MSFPLFPVYAVSSGNGEKQNFQVPSFDYDRPIAVQVFSTKKRSRSTQTGTTTPFLEAIEV